MPGLRRTVLLKKVPGRASNADRERNFFKEEEGAGGGNLRLPDEDPVEPASSDL
jgi:hypothetical protein